MASYIKTDIQTTKTNIIHIKLLGHKTYIE